MFKIYKDYLQNNSTLIRILIDTNKLGNMIIEIIKTVHQ